MRGLAAPSLLTLGILGMCLAPSATLAAENQPVLICMEVPANAEVWFNGTQTTMTGSTREFLSPAIAPGKKYTYQIRIRWMEDGKAVEQERSLSVHAGEQVNVDVSRKNVSVTRSDYHPPTANRATSFTTPYGYYGGYPASGYEGPIFSGPRLLPWESPRGHQWWISPGTD